MKHKKLKAPHHSAPEDVIAICERPGYLDHLVTSESRPIRVSVATKTENGEWVVLSQDYGTEVWLLEYPPHSEIAHVCLKGLTKNG